MRQRAWPAFLEIQDMDEAEVLLQAYRQSLQHDTTASSDLDIIRQDVHRSSMFRCQFVTGSIVKGEQQSAALQEKLVSAICAAVSTPTVGDQGNPSYYQGLHDVAFVLLFNLNYDEVTTVAVLRKLLQTHLRDATRTDFRDVLFLLNAVLIPFLQSIDPQVYQALMESEVPLSNSIMPWLITLFAHPVRDQAIASRLMDAFLTSHPMLPFYVAVALLVQPALRASILEATDDPCLMHMTIQGLPALMKNDFDVSCHDEQEMITAQVILDAAMGIMRRYPPESLVPLIGMGLPSKRRRRAVARARCIAVLGLPSVESSSFILRIKHAILANNLARHEVRAAINNMTNRVYGGYSVARKGASRVATMSSHSFMVLQVVFLFILMPQHYTRDFYQVVQAMSRFWSNDVRFISGGSVGTVKGAEHSDDINDTPLMYNENDLPGMIKSPSTLSMPELEHA